MRQNIKAIIQVYPKHSVWQWFSYRAFHFNQILFRQCGFPLLGLHLCALARLSLCHVWLLSCIWSKNHQTLTHFIKLCDKGVKPPKGVVKSCWWWNGQRRNGGTRGNNLPDQLLMTTHPQDLFLGILRLAGGRKGAGTQNNPTASNL